MYSTVPLLKWILKFRRMEAIDMMRPTRATRKWCVEFMVGSDLQWSRSAGFLRHFFTNHAGKVLNRLYADMRSHSFTL